jgi:hypothetical protein
MHRRPRGLIRFGRTPLLLRRIDRLLEEILHAASMSAGKRLRQRAL